MHKLCDFKVTGRNQPAHPLLYIRDMMKVLALAMSLPLVACVVGDATPPPESTGGGGGGGGGTGSGMGSGSGTGMGGLSGTISMDTTWSGNIKVGGALTIAAGVTVTAMAGTTVDFGQNGSLVVDGTLDLQGTAAAKVTFEPAPENTTGHYGTISLTGSMTSAFGILHGAGMVLADGSTFTATDSVMYGAEGDYLVMNGGTVNVTYSQLGAPTGATDTTHCNTHFNAATAITITHSNVNGSPYGMMYYSASNADLTYNNWYGNQTDIEPNATATGKADFGYFEKGTPAGVPGITFLTLSATMLTDAGPRG